MVEKLSSTSIISAASFDTSAPVRPSAMPISALRNAIASFTPSPVMPTTRPLACSAYRYQVQTTLMNITHSHHDTVGHSKPNDLKFV